MDGFSLPLRGMRTAVGSQTNAPKYGNVWLHIVLLLFLCGCGSSNSNPSTSTSTSGDSSTNGNSSQNPPGFPDDRTTFVRTDDTPLSVAYDPVHNLLFATALHLNCVDVISSLTAQVVKCVPVSGALGVSLSADGSKVLVGTQVGIVAWIDTISLQVVKRDTIPQIPQGRFTLQGSTYVSAAQAYQAANGKVLLFSNWGLKDLYGNFQSATLVEWDPSSNTSTVVSNAGGGGLVSVSADHQKILIAGQGAATLYDSVSDSFQQIPGAPAVSEPAMSPTGSQFALIGGSPLITFFNTQMQVMGSLNISVPNGFRPTGAVYSSDGRYLYVILPGTLPMLVTVDTTAFQVVGTAPAYSSQIAYFSETPITGFGQAADATGLVFEIADHGVAINDATNAHNFMNASGVSNFIVATPSEGLLNQQTATKFTTGTFGSLPDVFFGNQRALSPALNGPGQLQATAPPSGTPGPVNVKALQANGVMGFMPQAFTYGAVPLQYGTLASGPQGGVFANLFGYGYGVDIPGANIQVTIGNAPAMIAVKTLLPTRIPYPFPADYIAAAVPPGVPGPRDIGVVSPAGAATYPKGFHYVKSIIDYPSPDSSLLYLLYDSHRNLVYISAGDHIDVFSLATGSFTSSIAVPSNSGNRLILGLALTPDGSKLLAANQVDQSVAIINPDNPTSGVVAVSLAAVLAGMAGSPGPFQIATTSTNQAFVTVTVGNALSGGGQGFYDIDLSSLAISSVIPPLGAAVSINNNYIQASADGRVVIEGSSNSSGGPLLSWQASTQSWQSHLVEGQFWFDAAISGDGNVAVASSTTGSSFPFPYLFDSQLHLTAQVNSPEFQSAEEGPSVALDQSGALLYAVNPFGVDMIDARTGQLRERLLLSEEILLGPSEQLQSPSKTLAITPSGDHIFLLTTAGLTVVTLDSVPLGIGSVSPSAGPAGTLVTIRGTGIASGTTVTVNGIQAVTSFVDSSTLQVTIPAALQNGATQFILTNPDGYSFSLDAAFLIQ
jgi:DNA-binding beta-propeller fold protein YncE